MGIELVRIDDRLIHGQVATTWLKDFNIEQVIIVDDEVSNNEMKKNMALIAAPTGIKVHIFEVDKFINIIKNNEIKRKTLLLFTNPSDLKKVVDNYSQISKVYVGGMRASENKIKISKAVYVSEDEKRIFQELSLKGIELIVQTVPRDEKKNIIELL